MESMEAPSPPSQSLSRPCQLQHFYLAVDRPQFKMETVVELLNVVGRRPWLPIVICCSSRDELDAVCSSLSSLPYISLASLYSDLAERERAVVLERFRQATFKWKQHTLDVKEEGDDSEIGNEGKKSHLVVVTDVCLPMISSGESPLSARVLINYELPTKKETYMRRISTCLASDGIVINMVVGGEVVTLKSLEESSGTIIAEMPINISEIL
ncbi:PREDICTED: ATP-dependent RNA helicase FAL1 [Tarenaya hassleriana]|uniref:ATP-dependent RNA helicase FAL1 n=1 Tax=Tarenaya hassleriana TaxID=28532 RepID=UPI00053C3D13|nr:PREDICTED: ATP-dependent RNA helicase FAL1 [Tarenaya hassleriana]